MIKLLEFYLILLNQVKLLLYINKVEGVIFKAKAFSHVFLV